MDYGFREYGKVEDFQFVRVEKETLKYERSLFNFSDFNNFMFFLLILN